MVKAILAQLAVIHRFPLFFEKNLSGLRTTPDFITFDDRPIHGFACLAFPVIIPEHEYVIDDGTLIAQRRPQINLNRLENSFQEIPPRMPEDKKFELAFNAYVAAFATNNLPLTCLSLVTMLEVFMKEIRRSDTEIAALDLISNTISKDENLKKSDASKELLQAVLSSIGGRKNMGKEASLIALIDQHLSTIRALSGAEAFSEARPVAKAILKMRNAITHDAVFQNDEATYSTIRQLMNISQAVLLDHLGFQLTKAS
ncbi:hypothetical protein BI317_16785 [Xanthomonas hortorum pv. gardneri]|nr:hypothetical protein BI317_16785 [Xanthomonas hortorum pv. gardneri]